MLAEEASKTAMRSVELISHRNLKAVTLYFHLQSDTVCLL